MYLSSLVISMSANIPTFVKKRVTLFFWSSKLSSKIRSLPYSVLSDSDSAFMLTVIFVKVSCEISCCSFCSKRACSVLLIVFSRSVISLIRSLTSRVLVSFLRQIHLTRVRLHSFLSILYISKIWRTALRTDSITSVSCT